MNEYKTELYTLIAVLVVAGSWDLMRHFALRKYMRQVKEIHQWKVDNLKLVDQYHAKLMEMAKDPNTKFDDLINAMEEEAKFLSIAREETKPF